MKQLLIQKLDIFVAFYSNKYLRDIDSNPR